MNERQREQLSCFMYLLMRDHLPTGRVVNLIEDSTLIDKQTESYKFSNGHLGKLARDYADRIMEESGETPKELPDEKERRIYYKDIVYAVCGFLDEIDGKHISKGNGIVCGTSASPTAAVQDRMKELVKKLRNRQGVIDSARKAERDGLSDLVERNRHLFSMKAVRLIRGWIESREESGGS